MRRMISLLLLILTGMDVVWCKRIQSTKQGPICTLHALLVSYIPSGSKHDPNTWSKTSPGMIQTTRYTKYEVRDLCVIQKTPEEQSAVRPRMYATSLLFYFFSCMPPLFVFVAAVRIAAAVRSIIIHNVFFMHINIINSFAILTMCNACTNHVIHPYTKRVTRIWLLETYSSYFWCLVAYVLGV